MEGVFKEIQTDCSLDNKYPVAYIQGWLAKIRSDKRLVVVAAAQAQKAADYILNRTSEK